MAPDDEVDFDLDALILEIEEHPPFTFRWRGEKWQMIHAERLELADQLSLETATAEESLRVIMGDEQFDRFIAEPITVARASELIQRWRRFSGIDEGKSMASSGSSRSTARRSRQTSRSGRVRRTS